MAKEAQKAEAHLDSIRDSLDFGGVLLVSPVCSISILCHFMHVGGPDLDLNGDTPRALHGSVEGLVP